MSDPVLTLRWKNPIRTYGNVYIMKSECERYSIHAEKRGHQWRYTALVRTDLWNNVLGWVWSKAEAVDLCEAHVAKGQVAA